MTPKHRKDLDPEFAATLKKIERLNGAIRGVQTHIEMLLVENDGLDQERAKAEAKRLAANDGLTETELGLFIWACVMSELEGGSNASEKEKKALIPRIWARLKLEHETRVKELSLMMKSLTPEQRKFVSTMNRKRLLTRERRERKKREAVT